MSNAHSLDKLESKVSFNSSLNTKLSKVNLAVNQKQDKKS